jgi:hypothetical protein
MPDETEPLDAIHVRNWLRTETGPGCYVLFRPFEDGDPDRFLGKKTCLCVRSTPTGKTLDETLQGEVDRMPATSATRFYACPCATEIEIPPMLQVLNETYEPFPWAGAGRVEDEWTARLVVVLGERSRGTSLPCGPAGWLDQNTQATAAHPPLVDAGRRLVGKPLAR